MHLTVCLAALAAAAADPLYDFGPDLPIVQLDDANFESLVVKDDKHLWVVEFYADVCKHAHCAAMLLLMAHAAQKRTH